MIYLLMFVVMEIPVYLFNRTEIPRVDKFYYGSI